MSRFDAFDLKTCDLRKTGRKERIKLVAVANQTTKNSCILPVKYSEVVFKQGMQKKSYCRGFKPLAATRTGKRKRSMTTWKRKRERERRKRREAVREEAREK